ncbi:MAG: hypothetical protein ACK6AD_03010 [Cyanobacteriota bacterium]
MPDPTDTPLPLGTSSPEEPPSTAGHHDFEAQKRIHQQIRNDPDYDDWEYGTEPLPHEAWIAGRQASGQPPAPRQTPEPKGEGRSAGS